MPFQRGSKWKPCSHKREENLRHIDDAGKDERGMWHEFVRIEWHTGFWWGKLKSVYFGISRSIILK
jgi:hypothetical protein